MAVTLESLARFFEVTLPHMNELQRRVVAGAATEMLVRGGKTVVAAASGMSRNTVIKSVALLTDPWVLHEAARPGRGGV